MAELDVLLSASLKRVAQPGDPTGVADAIRDRVAAGDTGAPASTSGFGSRRWWVLWLGLGVVVLLVTGGAVAFGTVLPSAVVASPTATVVASPTPTPTRTATPTPTPTPTPVVTPTVEPVPEPEPEPPADTTAPVITALGASATAVFVANASHTLLTATITDDTGVAGATISWVGEPTGPTGSAAMQPGWTFDYVSPPTASTGTITFTVQAFDAAGNMSAPVSLTLPVYF